MIGRLIPSLVVLILALMALFVPAHASAQVAITAGAKGGVNFANVDLNLTGFTVSPKSRPGLIIGGFLAIDKHKAGLVDRRPVQPERHKLEFSDSGGDRQAGNPDRLHRDSGPRPGEPEGLGRCAWCTSTWARIRVQDGVRDQGHTHGRRDVTTRRPTTTTKVSRGQHRPRLWRTGRFRPISRRFAL